MSWRNDLSETVDRMDYEMELTRSEYSGKSKEFFLEYSKMWKEYSPCVCELNVMWKEACLSCGRSCRVMRQSMHTQLMGCSMPNLCPKKMGFRVLGF